jgi:hypothetical protein
LVGLDTETGAHRIILYVGHSDVEVAFIADHAIKVVCLPHCTRAAKHLIRLLCRERFPGLDDVTEHSACSRREENMHMVWHDHPGMQMIANSMEIQERFLYDPGNLWISQQAGAPARIEVGFDTSIALPCSDVLRQVRQFAVPYRETLLRERVSYPEGDELR